METKIFDSSEESQELGIEKVEKFLDTEIFKGHVVLVGSRREGGARADSDYDFILCPQDGPLKVASGFWDKRSADICKVFDWKFETIMNYVRRLYELPVSADVDLFILIEDSEGRYSTAMLSWNEFHQCLDGYMENESFEHVLPFIDKFIPDK